MKTLSFKLISLYILVIGFIAFLFYITQFEARENDSRLYTKFVAQLTHDKSLAELVALEWRNLSEYTDPHNPYVRDHFIGQFIFPVILSKLGFPSEYSLYFLNTLYRLLFIFVFYLIAKEFIEKEKAMVLLWALQLTPINLSYQLRANHEQLLTLSIACALLGMINIKKGYIYKFLLIMGFVMAFLTKGLAAIILFPTILFAWYICYFRNHPKNTSTLMWPLISFLSLGLVLIIYEIWFRKVTGYPFLEAYYQIQIYGRSIETEMSTHPWIIQKILNLFYYLSRIIINGLPWILFFLIILITKFIRNRKLVILDNPKMTNLILILSSFPVAYLILFSMSDRLAQRYIFPSYFFVNTMILLLLINEWEALKKFQNWLNSKIKPSMILFYTWGLLLLTAFAVYFLKGGHNHWIH